MQQDLWCHDKIIFVNKLLKILLRFAKQPKQNRKIQRKINFRLSSREFLVPNHHQPHASHPKTHFANWCLVKSKRETEETVLIEILSTLVAFLYCMCCWWALFSLSNWICWAEKQKLAYSPGISSGGWMNDGGLAMHTNSSAKSPFA